MKKLIILSFLFITACTSETEVLCDRGLNIDDGNFELISKQCIKNGSHATALVKLLDKSNGDIRTYTLNVIEGRIIINLDSVSAINHKISNDAIAIASASMAMNSASMSSKGR